MNDEKKQTELRQTIQNIASEQTEKTIAPSIVEWLESTNKHVKQMSQDETYRKEVAKHLS